MTPIIVAPSILSADLGRFDEELRALNPAEANWIYIDVMDCRFRSGNRRPGTALDTEAAQRAPADDFRC